MRGLVEPIDKISCNTCGSNYPLEHYHTKCLRKRDREIERRTAKEIFRKLEKNNKLSSCVNCGGCDDKCKLCKGTDMVRVFCQKEYLAVKKKYGVKL